MVTVALRIHHMISYTQFALCTVPHLRGEPRSGSNMNENITLHFKTTDLAIGEYIVMQHPNLFYCQFQVLPPVLPVKRANHAQVAVQVHHAIIQMCQHHNLSKNNLSHHIVGTLSDVTLATSIHYVFSC